MKKEKNSAGSILNGIATGVTVIILLIVVVVLLVFTVLGSVPTITETASSNLGTTDQFYMNASNAISDAMPSMIVSEKKYKINGNGATAPKPDKSCYGSAANQEEMTSVIARSEKLLDGQSLYFSTVSGIYADFGVEYYQDDTILAITWKKPLDGTMYTFSEIKIADPTQFRRYLAGGSYGSGTLSYPTEMANTVHAVVAFSGDYFEYRGVGTVVYDSEVYRAVPGADICYIDNKGDLILKKNSDFLPLEKAKQFVKDNNILFSLAFGPILVENGEKVDYGNYPLGEVSQSNSRAALCQWDTLHYLLITANAEDTAATRPSMAIFSKHVYETGCDKAYAVDGGQTTALIMGNVLINQIIRGYQRKISDIIYFATAIPNS